MHVVNIQFATHSTVRRHTITIIREEEWDDYSGSRSHMKFLKRLNTVWQFACSWCYCKWRLFGFNMVLSWLDLSLYLRRWKTDEKPIMTYNYFSDHLILIQFSKSHIYKFNHILKQKHQAFYSTSKLHLNTTTKPIDKWVNVLSHPVELNIEDNWIKPGFD